MVAPRANAAALRSLWTRRGSWRRLYKTSSPAENRRSGRKSSCGRPTRPKNRPKSRSGHNRPTARKVSPIVWPKTDRNAASSRHQTRAVAHLSLERSPLRASRNRAPATWRRTSRRLSRPNPAPKRATITPTDHPTGYQPQWTRWSVSRHRQRPGASVRPRREAIGRQGRIQHHARSAAVRERSRHRRSRIRATQSSLLPQLQSAAG